MYRNVYSSWQHLIFIIVYNIPGQDVMNGSFKTQLTRSVHYKQRCVLQRLDALKSKSSTKIQSDVVTSSAGNITIRMAWANHGNTDAQNRRDTLDVWRHICSAYNIIQYTVLIKSRCAVLLSLVDKKISKHLALESGINKSGDPSLRKADGISPM